MEYLNTAKELGNQLENVKNNENLLEYLTQVSCTYTLDKSYVFTVYYSKATVMVVSVPASTTQGKDLTKEEFYVALRLIAYA